MIELFQQGGLFMWPLTALALAALLIAGKQAIDVFVNEKKPASVHRSAISAVLQIGIFSFFLGILAQGLGLFHALRAIERAADISPAIVVGGLRVSMIPPLYGLLIFLAAFAVLKRGAESREA